MSGDLGTTLVTAAFRVCTALEKTGATAVLTGGSAATFYAPTAYQSHDIDFVITVRSPDGGGEEALKAIGYERKGDYYVHADWPFPLEFLPGPLGIGDDLISTWETVRRHDETLHVLSPTDCVRDRLAAYLFWKDFSGLEQALAVARAQRAELDLDAVRDWCHREGHLSRYLDFATELNDA